MRWNRVWPGCVVGVVGVMAACSSGLDSSASAPGADHGSFGTSGGAGTGAQIPGAGGTGGSGLPPEHEMDQTFRAPVVSGQWVWTANPDTGRVAVIDARTFAVRVAEAGSAPTYLTALPALSGSRALVINTGSHDATLLEAGTSGAPSATRIAGLSDDANAWTVSKAGHFALAWSDAAAAVMPDPTQGFQDLTVLDLRATPPVATRLSVGFRPMRVFIDESETQAYVVCAPGITVIDLSSALGPRVLRDVAVSAKTPDDALSRDVSVLPDGSYALVRREGSAAVTLVEIATGKLTDVTLSGPVTDLDLAPDATSALALVCGGAVLGPTPDGGDDAAAGAGGEAGATGSDLDSGTPDSGTEVVLPSTLAILPLPGIFSDPAHFDSVSLDDVFGQVAIAPQAQLALLFTNATQSSHVAIVNTAAGADFLAHRTVDVRGFVGDVSSGPDGAYAIATLDPRASGNKPGFAVIPVGTTLPVRVQTTEAKVIDSAMGSGAHARAVVTTSDGAASFAAYVVRMPELAIDRVVLASRPLPHATGLVPDAGVAYVAEQHPDGRITFIDLETGVPHTITGYEIAAKVINGN